MISSARCEGYQIGFTITFSLLRTFHSCRYTALQHAGGVLAVTALNLLILCDELKPKVLDDCLEHGVVWLNAVHALDFGELMEQGPERDGLVEQPNNMYREENSEPWQSPRQGARGRTRALGP